MSNYISRSENYKLLTLHTFFPHLGGKSKPVTQHFLQSVVQVIKDFDLDNPELKIPRQSGNTCIDVT